MPDWLVLPSWLDWKVASAIVGVLFVLIILRRIRAAIRRRRPAKINPKLVKYGGISEEEREAEVNASLKIIATSSTSTVAGYRIIRQIEAVFVDGHKSPSEAVTALKAAAARRGANALINLSQQRTSAGRCTAQGDAVVVQAENPTPAPPRKA